MAQNLASINLTAADITALKGALQTVRTTLGKRAVSLTPGQRQSLVKMGDKTRPFCEQAVPALTANAASMPPDLDLPGLAQDLADFQALDPIFDDFQQVGELLDDTLKALSSDILTNCIAGIAVLKAVNKLNPRLDTLLQNLSTVRRQKPVKKAKPAKP